MVNDSIQLWIFTHTLTGNAAKWYTELPRALVNTFGALAMEFLKHFQLPIRYETRTELLNSLCEDTATHIFGHIHEWRRRQRLVKSPLLNYLLVGWFYKSLLPQIAKYVALGGVIMEDQSIYHA